MVTFKLSSLARWLNFLLALFKETEISALWSDLLFCFVTFVIDVA